MTWSFFFCFCLVCTWLPLFWLPFLLLVCDDVFGQGAEIHRRQAAGELHGLRPSAGATKSGVLSAYLLSAWAKGLVLWHCFSRLLKKFLGFLLKINFKEKKKFETEKAGFSYQTVVVVLGASTSFNPASQSLSNNWCQTRKTKRSLFPSSFSSFASLARLNSDSQQQHQLLHRSTDIAEKSTQHMLHRPSYLTSNRKQDLLTID